MESFNKLRDFIREKVDNFVGVRGPLVTTGKVETLKRRKYCGVLP